MWAVTSVIATNGWLMPIRRPEVRSIRSTRSASSLGTWRRAWPLVAACTIPSPRMSVPSYQTPSAVEPSR